MNRNLVIILLGGLLTIAYAQLPEWVQLTAAGTTEQTVPFATVKQIADKRARSMWSKTEPGPVIPLCDIDGNILAYMFHYRIDGQQFPDYALARDEILTELPLLDGHTHHSRYAHVLASARYDRAPILRYGEGGTEYYITLEQARMRAREILGGLPVLTRVYYVWPLTYYEFSTAGRSIVIEAHTFTRTMPADEFRNYVRTGEQRAWQEIQTLSGYADDRATAEAKAAARMRAEWQRWLAREERFETTAVFVPEHRKAPFYDWSYGCSPTAGTMVVGYLDAAQGTGRAIYDFFQRWDCVERELDYQIPWAQRRIALAFQTDTMSGGTYPTQIGPGLQSFLQEQGYDYYIFSAIGGYYNDWLWVYDSSEIWDGHPMVWSISWETHSLAAFGVRWSGEDRDMYVHNTWWRPGEWWHYSDGSVHSRVDISSIHSSSTDPSIRLLTPRGDTLYAHNGAGEILWGGRPNTIRWDNAGVPNDSLTIDLSTDGGWTWVNLAHGIPDSGYYVWELPASAPSSLNRLRLKAFAGGEYRSGDGSYGNFRITTLPLPPIPLSPQSGRVFTAPPVVLIVDTMAWVDSYQFKVWHNYDTIFTRTAPSPICTLPTELFRYGNLYAWNCRCHNSMGWGDPSTSSGFWVRWAAVEESPEPAAAAPHLTISGPVTAEARIRFVLHDTRPVRLRIDDVSGRLVREFDCGRLAPGSHEFVWNLNDLRQPRLPAGCYFISLFAGPERRTAKLAVLLF